MTSNKKLTPRETVFLTLAVLFTLAGVGLQVVPGMKFSGQLSSVIAVGCIAWLYICGWAERSGTGKRVKRVFVGCLCAGLAVFAALEVYLLSYGVRDDRMTPADAVIVLGAGVNGSTPSLALQTRINTAAAYAALHPGVPLVLSGGQGSGEDITEAQAMYNALFARCPDNALWLEDKATSTAENFCYSKELLRGQGIDPDSAQIAIVTNDFHMARACLLARRQGLSVLTLPTPLPYGWLTVNYYIREAFALVKTFFFDW